MTPHSPAVDSLTVFAPQGMLGYGIPERSMRLGMERRPSIPSESSGPSSCNGRNCAVNVYFSHHVGRSVKNKDATYGVNRKIGSSIKLCFRRWSAVSRRSVHAGSSHREYPAVGFDFPNPLTCRNV